MVLGFGVAVVHLHAREIAKLNFFEVLAAVCSTTDLSSDSCWI
jgi:hypothetical protein